MRFDWDPDKNVTNTRKHDITFNRALQVFDDPSQVKWICSDPGDVEKRYMVVGMVGWRLGSVVYPESGDTIHLLSARKANPRERQLYRQGKAYR